MMLWIIQCTYLLQAELADAEEQLSHALPQAPTPPPAPAELHEADKETVTSAMEASDNPPSSCSTPLPVQPSVVEIILTENQVCVCVCLSVCLFVCLAVCCMVCVSVCLCVCLSVLCACVCLSVFVSVCLCDVWYVCMCSVYMYCVSLKSRL